MKGVNDYIFKVVVRAKSLEEAEMLIENADIISYDLLDIDEDIYLPEEEAEAEEHYYDRKDK